jgi:hypothetical protein
MFTAMSMNTASRGHDNLLNEPLQQAHSVYMYSHAHRAATSLVAAFVLWYELLRIFIREGERDLWGVGRWVHFRQLRFSSWGLINSVVCPPFC